ncbi:MAG: diguanylate cyclase [Armatimonadetes bacterium]|nr:diguanylate cyclase [Armatimonadota bacterium]
MRRAAVLAVTVALAIGLVAARPRAVEISPYLAFGALPALGIHQIELLRTYVNRDVDLTLGYNLLADFEFRRAIPFLERAAARSGAPLRLRSEANTFLGYAYLNLREPARAIQHLEAAIRENPANEIAHFYLANEHYLDGKPQSVKEELLRAVRIRPSFVSALRMLAETYRDEGNLSEAIARYEQIVKLLPNSGYFRYQLYKAYADAGRWRDAQADLQELIRLEPAFALNYYRLGEVNLKLGDEPGARAAFQRLTEVGGSAFDHLASLGAARIHLARNELDLAHAAARRALDMRPDNHEIRETIRAIEERGREQQLEFARRAAAVGATVVLMAALAWALLMAQRRKQVLAVMSRFTQQAERIYEQDELADFILKFFAELLARPRGMMLTFNRQSHVVASGRAAGMEGVEPPRLHIVTGNEVTRWASRSRGPAYRVDQLDAQFEEVFPTLADRLRGTGFELLLPLHEKASFLGFIALGPAQSGRRAQADRDVLEPLVTSAAQTLETLYLYESSMLDEGTGLNNKRYFKQQLATEVRRADRYQQPCSLLALDLDNFKKINDVYGHAQGDQVLRELGTVVRHAIREGIDTAARTGGEEFYLILPATSAERAETVAERLRQAVEEHAFSGFTRPLKVTVSIGLATYPEHASGEHDLVRRADTEVYRAKRAGKNQVCVAAETGETADAEARLPRLHTLESRYDNLNILDEQTSLRNFTYFSMRLREEIKRVARYRFPCSLLALRPAVELPDEQRTLVLKQLGVLLRESLREGIDTPARLEGDDIGVILPETPFENATRLAERLRGMIAARTFYPLTEPLAVVMGVAAYPQCATSDNNLLEVTMLALRGAQHGAGPVVQAPMLPVP